ncbi:UBX domain-containing protein 4 [Octodon degus]|uniref:UBX domain-containing protein 4 n=1 Tax=Octodon degus TaxID=10160 RepID=A0A6P6DZV8_OCTDE|nr:UBX domain-containing protein 4 [Octodon degus]
MLEERSREKAEDRAARERIKQQIALDRAERAARFAKTKEEVEAARAAALLAKQAEMEGKRESYARERSTIARIQFRLPDGSSFTNQFSSDAPLEEARQFAAQTVGNTYGNFSLATMFPRREFTKEDYKKKLSVRNVFVFSSGLHSVCVSFLYSSFYTDFSENAITRTFKPYIIWQIRKKFGFDQNCGKN